MRAHKQNGDQCVHATRLGCRQATAPKRAVPCADGPEPVVSSWRAIFAGAQNIELESQKSWLLVSLALMFRRIRGRRSCLGSRPTPVLLAMTAHSTHPGLHWVVVILALTSILHSMRWLGVAILLDASRESGP